MDKKTIFSLFGLLSLLFNPLSAFGAGFNFDPDGLAGDDPPVLIEVFDILPSSVLDVDGVDAFEAGVGSKLTSYNHGRTGVLLHDGDVVSAPGLNNSYELTTVLGIGQQVLDVSTNFLGHNMVVIGLDTDSTTNFFEIWQGPINADELQGTGFNDGNRILTGTLIEALAIFTADPNNIQQYDQFPGNNDASDNYPGITTVTGAGSSTVVKIRVDSFDADYFVDFNVGDIITIAYQNLSFQLPYTSIDPSKRFTGGPGGVVAPTVLPDIDTINGIDGPDVQQQTDLNFTFDVEPVEQPIACRITVGGVDTDENWNHELDDGTMVRNGVGHLPEGIDRYQFGGQHGARSVLDPVSGEHTHHQQRGPSGKFTFHGGTRSAPDGTRIVDIRCSDPETCTPSGNPPSPAKQLDSDGIGTFKSIGKGGNAPMFSLDENTVPPLNATAEGHGNRAFDGTFHFFQVNFDDNGEGPSPAGGGNSGAPDPVTCPSTGFGENGAVALADCDCPDFYRIKIYNGVDAADVTRDAEGNIELSSMDTTNVIYQVYGYLDGGNLQIHQVTGFDSK